MELTGADILALDDRPKKPVVVPQWDGAEIYVRKMSARERATMDVKMINLNDAPLDERMWQIKALCVTLCACNEDGTRLFSNDDFEAVADKDVDAINLIYAAADKLNLITQNEVETEAGE